jgi:hypothetical protein
MGNKLQAYFQCYNWEDSRNLVDGHELGATQPCLRNRDIAHRSSSF